MGNDAMAKYLPFAINLRIGKGITFYKSHPPGFIVLCWRARGRHSLHQVVTRLAPSNPDGVERGNVLHGSQRGSQALLMAWQCVCVNVCRGVCAC